MFEQRERLRFDDLNEEMIFSKDLIVKNWSKREIVDSTISIKRWSDLKNLIDQCKFI
jgi:hypothetical protein